MAEDRSKYLQEYQKRPDVQKRRKEKLSDPENKYKVLHQQRVRRKRKNKEYKYYMLTLLDLFDQITGYKATYIEPKPKKK